MLGVHIGGMLGPILFGRIVDHWGGYNMAWGVTAGIVILGTIGLAFFFKEGAQRG